MAFNIIASTPVLSVFTLVRLSVSCQLLCSYGLSLLSNKSFGLLSNTLTFLPKHELFILAKEDDGLWNRPFGIIE